ncbi:MAG: type VI secretion system tube protein Hcp [Myxococcales bacterium]|nr:type VI secretion system tube protein Hcp [Myxococcales bacterium]
MSSYQFYVKVKGSKQGAFKGESPMVDRTDWINGVRFRFKGEIPLDPQRGLSSGLPRHDPIVVTKLWGASSPQILQAFWDAEVLDEVIIEFVEADGQGQPRDGLRADHAQARRRGAARAVLRQDRRGPHRASVARVRGRGVQGRGDRGQEPPQQDDGAVRCQGLNRCEAFSRS